MKLLAFAVLTLALAASSAVGDDFLLLYSKAPPPKKGEELKVTVETTTVTRLTVSSAAEKGLTTETELKSQFVYIEVVEDVGQKFRMKRRYEKALITRKNGDGTSKDQTLEGKTLAIQKKGDSFEFTIKEGGFGKPDGHALAALEEEFSGKVEKDLRKEFFPNRSVKTKDTWPIVSGDWVKSLGAPEVVLQTQLFTGLGTAKLTANKAKPPKDKEPREPDKPYGEIEVDFSVPILGMHLGEKPDVATALRAEKSSKLVGKIESKGMADGTLFLPRETKVTLTYDLTGAIDGCDVKFHMTISEARKVEKK